MTIVTGNFLADKWQMADPRRRGDSHEKRTEVLVAPLRIKKVFLVPLRVFSFKRSTVIGY